MSIIGGSLEGTGTIAGDVYNPGGAITPGDPDIAGPDGTLDLDTARGFAPERPRSSRC